MDKSSTRGHTKILTDVLSPESYMYYKISNYTLDDEPPAFHIYS